MTTLTDFPNAPSGSWICEEGWLIIGDEAWTADEWRHMAYYNGAVPKPRPTKDPQVPRRIDRRIKYQNDDERVAARRRQKREHMRRVRSA